jgi:serine phosphatase RsbU (regulator of sigma subunit)
MAGMQKNEPRAPAGEILDAVLREVDAFCHPIPRADDITLVIIKVETPPSR